MPRVFSARLSETWLKAAIAGSLWASFEIIIGSFLHNMRMPFAGTILAFSSVGLIIAFVQVWKNRGLVWRAGLIAALLKSMSPSAIILGPMIGIFSEALIIEFFLVLFGRNLLSYMLGGGVAVLSALFHKIVSLIVTYGFDLIVIVEQLYKYLVKQLGMSQGNPVLLVSMVMIAYFVIGLLGAVLGFQGGRKAISMTSPEGQSVVPDKNTSFFKESKDQKTSPGMLILHLFSIVICLYLLNVFPLQYAFLPSIVYASFSMYWYRGSMRSFRKTSFWIWFMAITILAAVFWNALSTGEIWSVEGLLVGLKMNLRAIVILTGFASVSTELRNPIIRTVLYHHGFANLYHAVGLAFSVLPGIIESIPGVRKLIKAPVGSLGSIVKQAAGIYPALEKEVVSQTPVIIITGDVGQGKTSYLKEILSILQNQGLSLAGFIAEGVHENDTRLGYDLVDIENGNSSVYIRTTSNPGWFRHGKYYFSSEGEIFGRKILGAIDSGKTDIVVIDEIGPVELKGKAWAESVSTLVNESRMMQLWVVRKPILNRVIRNWKIGDIMILDIEVDQSKDAAEAIIQFNFAHKK